MNDAIPRGVLVMVLERRGLQPAEIRDILGDVDEEMDGPRVAGLRVREDPEMPDNHVELRGPLGSVRFEIVEEP